MIKTKLDFPFYALIKSCLLLISDLLGCYSAMFCAIMIRLALPKIFTKIHFPFLMRELYFSSDMTIFFVFIFIVFVMNNLYQKRRTFWEELLIIWKSLLIASLFCYVFLFNFNYLFPLMSRLVIALFFICLAFFIPLYRSLLKKILFMIAFWRTPVILVCHNADISKAITIAKAFRKDFYLGFTPVCFFIQDRKEDYIEFQKDLLPIYDKMTQLPQNATVFVISESFSHEQELVSKLYSKYRKVYIIPYIGLVGMINSGIQYLFSERLFIIKLENQLNSLLAIIIKSSSDKILGLLITIVVSPLLILIALLVKISSKGSIFYKQSRIGKDGKSFEIFKFRTMYPNADQKLQELLNSDPAIKQEWEKYFKLKKDPRITPIGSFLRKYSLDEFPQLFNVLLGNMSLVGPRPFVKGEIEAINPSLLPLYAQVKPGLTGLWQVSGRNDTDRIERMKIDVWYIQNWSPSLDLLILLNTPKAVLTARGAH